MKAECAFVVNMTTKEGFPYEDLSCVLSVGDYPEVKHESYIVYSKAERVPKNYILENLKRKRFVLKEDISEKLLKRIQKGAIDNDNVPAFIEDYINYF